MADVDVSVSDAAATAESISGDETPYEVYRGGIIVDTAISAAHTIFSDDAWIQNVQWSNVTSASHLCSVTSENGERVLFKASGTAATGTVSLENPGLHRGPIKIDDMDSGTLHIVFK